MASIQLFADPIRILDAGQRLHHAPGSCRPFGASCPPGCRINGDTGRVNLALASRSAERASILFFEPDSGSLVLELVLDKELNRTGYVWHAELGGLKRPLRYAWKLDGVPVADPWSRALLKVQCENQPMYHSFFPLPPHEWKAARPARRGLQDLVIYELHVKGFTANENSGVDAPGTYKGLAEKIPYLRELGVTAVELMPVHEFDPEAIIFHNPYTGRKLRNYWGYDPVGLMAPVSHYAGGSHPLQAVQEFREMVDAFHAAGIEVILDVVLNHTAEGSSQGPTLNFRGMDEAVWYMRDEHGQYLDFTGCGNTFNCNHPIVRDYLLHCLRSWVTDFGVDGFRFDLAAVMGRSRTGAVLPNAPVLEQITLDPVLADSRLIAEAWDAAGLYQVGSFDAGLEPEDSLQRPGGEWSEWNGRFRDEIRRLVRGEAGLTGAAATRICGSSDLFQWNGQAPAQSLNFITCHDGFTLRDLVSYNGKHNEINGEDNRDGLNDNLSWNCGAEGLTEDPAVLALRARQQRNLLALLFLSQGTPMLLAGDEMGRSQQGNNNAWCQDNELSWMDWTQLERNKSLFEFTRGLIKLRADHACLRHDRFLSGDDIEWHGTRPFEPDFGSSARALAWRLRGLNGGARVPDPDLYVAFNFWQEDLHFQPPEAGAGKAWKLLLDTYTGKLLDESGELERRRPDPLVLKPYSLVVLAAEKSNQA